MPSIDLEKKIFFLHSLWLWLNYFASPNTVIGVIRIQTSVFSCVEKCTNPKGLRNSPELLQASHLIRPTPGCCWTQLFNYSSYTFNSSQHTEDPGRAATVLPREKVKYLLKLHLERVCSGRLTNHVSWERVFSHEHHCLGILRGMHFTPLVFHLVSSNSCWCVHHSCLQLIMKGGTITTSALSAPPLSRTSLNVVLALLLLMLPKSSVNVRHLHSHTPVYVYSPLISFYLDLFLTCVTFAFFLSMHFWSSPHSVKKKEQLLHSSVNTHTHTDTLNHHYNTTYFSEP